MIDFAFASDVPRLPYLDAWELQRRTHADVVAGRTDTVLLLEHPSVFTAGRRTDDSERPTDGTGVIDVDRGGKITWHGPGQLVGYPIVRLGEPVDVVAYVRRLERLLIGIVRHFGVDGHTVDGRSGVWVGDDAHAEKVAAIGIRVANGVTMHGFALNCDNTLDAYAQFVPCGIRDAGVTTLSRETGRDVTPADAAQLVIARFEELVMERADAGTHDFVERSAATSVFPAAVPATALALAGAVSA